LTIAVPALQERKSDLPWLLDALLTRAAAAVEKPIASLSPEAHDLIAAHTWPGNVGELYQVVLAACLRAKGSRLEAADLPWHLRKGPEGPPPALPLDALLEQVERKLLTLALRLTGNKKNRAAELLSIWRPRLLRRLEALKIHAS
jgi:DNA-binding NtrC family response regulator